MSEEDTYVAVVERAPHMNEELMVVFAKEVKRQHLCEVELSPSLSPQRIVHGSVVAVAVGRGH